MDDLTDPAADAARAKYSTEQLNALGDKGHAFKNADGSYSYPIEDAEDLDNAIHAVGRGGADHDAIRRYVAERAKAMGLADKIPDTWNPDGSMTRSQGPDDWTSAGPCERSFELNDMSIRADGTGRTVVAYAAVFNSPAEINDQDGHYIETIDPVAFNKTINDRSGRIGVFYNHGKTLYGTPSERFSMPLGTPLEIKADPKGVLTVTRYNRNPLADEILESIHNGDIKGQSFSGRFIASKRIRGRAGDLDTIHRSEVAMREYGPTPMPAYKEAAVLGVRTEELIDGFRALTPDQQAEVLASVNASRTDREQPIADAAQGTAATIPAPDIHEGPTPDQRLRRARMLALTAPKGPLL